MTTCSPPRKGPVLVRVAVEDDPSEGDSRSRRASAQGTRWQAWPLAHLMLSLPRRRPVEVPSIDLLERTFGGSVTDRRPGNKSLAVSGGPRGWELWQLPGK